MKIQSFDWDDGNHRKCQKHGVSLEEIESIFDDPMVILPDRVHPSGEKRWRAVGTTLSGRKAFVVFTLRQRGDGILLRPISARYMHKQEVESYEEEDYPDL